VAGRHGGAHGEQTGSHGRSSAVRPSRAMICGNHDCVIRCN
jgi:hypothetical protein